MSLGGPQVLEPQPQALVTHVDGLGDRDRDGCLEASRVGRVADRLAEGQTQLHPDHPLGRQLHRAMEQADARGGVAALHGALAGGAEPVGGAVAQRTRDVVVRAEPGTVVVCFGEVVSDELVELLRPVAGRDLEVVGEAFVQHRPARLWQ